MSCSCSKDHRVKPYETCIFCGHKHLSAAMAMTDDSYRIGQLILASWHYRKDFSEMDHNCVSCVELIERGEPFENFLSELCVKSWEMVLEHQESKESYARKNADDPMPFSPNIIMAHRSVAAANALYHEINYRDVNSSAAIGQLIIAAWHLDRQFHELALQCRECWQKIERLAPCRTELESLQKSVWELCR